MYALPLTYEHAALLMSKFETQGTPFRAQLRDLKARCITWLQEHSTPTTKLEPKFCPSNDHPKFPNWQQLIARRHVELPPVEAMHPASVRPEELSEALLNNRTPEEVLLPISTRVSELHNPVAAPARKNWSRPKMFGHSRSGKRSIVLGGVTGKIAALMVRSDSIARRTLLAKMIADWDCIGRPHVRWDQQEQLYKVSTEFRPVQTQFSLSNAANPTLEMGGVINPQVPHMPLVIQWASAPHYPVCDQSARNPFYSGEEPNPTEIATKLLNVLTPGQHVRFDHYPKLLQFRTKRRSMRGYFVKGLMLHYQLSNCVMPIVLVWSQCWRGLMPIRLL